MMDLVAHHLLHRCATAFDQGRWDDLAYGSLQRTGVGVPVLAVGAAVASLAGERVRVAVDAVTTVRRSPNVIGEMGALDAGRLLMAGGHP